VRCCHAVADGPVTRKVLVDGRPVAGADRWLFPYTGGWSGKKGDWRNIWLASRGRAARVHLTPGAHTLTMINDCGKGLNLDWIRIVPAAPPE